MNLDQPDFSRQIRPNELTDLNKALAEFQRSCVVAHMNSVCVNGRNIEASDGYMTTSHGGLLATCSHAEIAKHIAACINAVPKLIHLLDEACKRLNERPAAETPVSRDSSCPYTGRKHKACDGHPNCFYCGAVLTVERCAAPLSGVDEGDKCERKKGHTGLCGLDPI